MNQLDHQADALKPKHLRDTIVLIMDLLRQNDWRVASYLAFVTLGVWLGRAEWMPAADFTVAAALAFAAWAVRKHLVLMWILACTAALTLGLSRGQQLNTQLAGYEDLIGQSVTVNATIDDDPVRSDKGQRQFYADKITIGDQELPGRMRVSGYGADGLRRGDQVEIIGKLRDGFGPYQSAVSFAEIEATSRSSNPVEDIRSRFFAAINTLISDPESSLGLGFIVGLRALLPEDLLDQLGRTGLTHIVAVSGYNLTVIIRLVRRVAAKRSRFLAAASAVALVSFFLAVTGLVPSVFRASIIAGASLGAWYYGLRVRPITLIFLGSAVTAFINPLFIWFDIGWWLSFLAFFGVMIIGPSIIQRIYGDKQPGFLPQIAIETTSAQLMTMPLIIYTFGQASIIAVLANVLIAPLIPLAMALVAIAGFTYLVFPFLAGWVAWPAQLLLSAMIDLIGALSNTPGSLAEVSISKFQMLALYASIGLVTAGLLRGRKPIEGSYLVE